MGCVLRKIHKRKSLEELNHKYLDKYNEILKDKLLNEWHKHGKIIIAVDFDDTVFPYNAGKKHPAVFQIVQSEVFKLLRKAIKIGAHICVFTSSSEERFPEIRKYFIDRGIELSSINENPVPIEFGNHGKMFANLYIDDKAGLRESINTLDELIKKINNSH